MEYLIIGLIIAAILFGAEYLLTTKLQSPLWGGIIPLIVLAGTIYVFTSGIVSLGTNVLPFILLNTLMLADWVAGREKYKKIQKQELDKIKVQDI